MDVLVSTEFRKTYARLTEETLVTVNGRPIGIWQPYWVMSDHPPWGGPPDFMRNPLVTAQAQRDDLLRKINRSR